MQPFNFEVCQGDSTLTYTIIPEQDHYTIMFHDRIIAAIALQQGKWREIPLAKVHSHDLEIASSGLHQEGSFLKLPVEEIGNKISLLQAGLPESGKDCNELI